MKAINFGSLNLDYVYAVDSFVRPGETKACLRSTVMAGGKGLNQSIAMAAAGVTVFHAGYIGKDGSLLAETLKDKDVGTDYLKTLEDRTGHAIIQVDSRGENCILLSPGTNAMLSEAYVSSVLNAFGPGDIVVVQNETNLVPYIIKEAHARGLRVAATVAPINEAVREYPLALVDWLFVNQVEGSFLSGKDSPKEIVEKLGRSFPRAGLVLTLGNRGSLAYVDRQLHSQPAFSVEAVDTTAAGDTFTGYFLAALGEKKTLDEALRLAGAAGALAVTVHGAAASIPDRAQVEAFLRQQEEK